MKKSNKVIALIFGLLILIPALVVATILIRYNNGSFTRVEPSQLAFSKKLQGIDNITLTELSNLVIIPADSFSLAWDMPNKFPSPEFFTRNDSAFFTGTANIIRQKVEMKGNGDKEIRQRYEPVVRLYLPAGKTVSLINCSCRIIPENNETSIQEISLKLSHSNLNSDLDDDKKVLLNRLHLDADNSSVNFSSIWDIGLMDLILKNESEFKGDKATIRELSINVDPSSNILLSGQQLQRITQKK